MPSALRFTGKNPPPELWQEYPNWRNAYEEEGYPDQDETTLMPHEIQTYIAPYTSFTAGSVRLHDGREFPAFLAVGQHRIDGCEVYETARPWRIYYNHPAKRWLPFRAEWLPEARRPPFVSLNDETVFPMELRMLVPWREGNPPSVYRFTSDGQLVDVS